MASNSTRSDEFTLMTKKSKHIRILTVVIVAIHMKGKTG